MKPLMLPLLFLLAFSSGFATDNDPHRTFQDTQGRTIRAVIVRTGNDKVWIRRDDGQTFRVALSTFSEDDREFISRWERRNALKAPSAFEFSARRYTDGRENEKTDSRKTTVQRYGYIVTVTNRTPIDLEELSIEYRIFAWRGDLGQTGQKRDLEAHPGTAWIAKLAAREEQEFKTDPIPLTSVSLRPGWVFGSRDANSNQRRISDDLGGIWVRLKQDDEIIAEFSVPSKLKETETW